MKKVLLLVVLSLAFMFTAEAQGQKPLKNLPPEILSSASILVLQLPEEVFLANVQKIQDDLNSHGLQIIDHYNVNRNPTIQKKEDEAKAKELDGKNVKYQVFITFGRDGAGFSSLDKETEGVMIMVVPVTADLRPGGSYFRIDGKSYTQAMEKLGKELSKLRK